MDHWYYLYGSETRGPVPAAQIAQLIRAGSLSPATQVAQAGWQNWSPASISLAPLLASGPQAAPPPPAPTFAIRVQCIAGPDAGKAFIISAPEVSLGRVSGIGLYDPHVADNHVVLSWQNNVLHFRTLAGAPLRVAGVEVTHGTLSNGQQFQMGLSTWQVGSSPVELTSLLSSLGSRLNRLTSTDKLEGFSLGAMFSETFKGRSTSELESYFIVGTEKTTPPLEEVQTGWPKPWFYMRVLLFMAGIYLVLYQMFETFHNPKLVPGLMVMGAFVVPLATVFLFWELNTPRNVRFSMVLMLVLLGGVISLFFSLIAFSIANLEWLGAASAGICEETGKLLAVVLVARNLRHRYILNGLVFGAAIGGGFSAFETAGYAFDLGFFDSFLEYFLKNPRRENVQNLVGSALFYGYDQMVGILHARSLWAPVTHIAWTAISAGALWRIKGGDKFHPRMLFEPTFLRTFLIPVGLHMIWNSPLRFPGMLSYIKPIGLGLIGWYVVLTLVQQGLRQIRDMQVAQAETELKRTQEVLTESGRFRARQMQG